MTRRGGSSLVEVVVSLVVLEVGVLAALGLLAAAGREMAAATLLERGVSVADGVVDSLVRSPGVAAGSRLAPPLRVRWHGSAELLEVEVLHAPPDTLLFRVEAPRRVHPDAGGAP